MKFSVLLPTRNRLDLLRYAVETVIRQDYDNWEIIISDNCSEEDIAGYVTSLNESRIHYSRTEQFVSVTDNWNNTLNRASGDYVIMLGDDDGLMPGYFRTMIDLINKYEKPDLIYTDAYLFAYAGALPDFASGMLRHGYNTYFASCQPFLIERPAANAIVQRALNLEIPIFYNMQLSTIRMNFIRSLADQGAFFQSPFPDYYATIVSFLKSSRVLIYQQPIVTIGISKKSFGFYFFSGREKEGESFLNNVPEQQSSRLRTILIPGSVEYNCRMIAMDTVALNYPQDVQRVGAAVNYTKYRATSIRISISNRYWSKLLSHKDFTALREAVTMKEWLRYGVPYTIVYGLLGLFSMDQRNRVRAALQTLKLLPKQPETLWQPTPCQTLIDVFEQLPSKLDESKP